MMMWLRIALVAWVLSLAGCQSDGYLVEEKRALEVERDGRWAGYGVSYGPYRLGQEPGGEMPSVEELREDLRILDEHFDLIRMYGTDSRTEKILEIIADEGLGLRVLLGAWLVSDTVENEPGNADAGRRADAEGVRANRRQIEELVRLTNAYAGVVWAVNVGNESQVWWSDHRISTERLIEHLVWVRKRTTVPVTTADDYNFWNKPESVGVSDVCDFIALHVYGMWNKQTLETAVGWQEEQLLVVRELHGEIPVAITETGWATSKIDTGWQGELIVGEPGETPQVEYTEAFMGWAAEKRVVHFLFEAFDEPWKGGDDPAEVEKHWGLWNEDRTAKPAAEWLMTRGPRAVLERED